MVPFKIKFIHDTKYIEYIRTYKIYVVVTKGSTNTFKNMYVCMYITDINLYVMST